MLTDKRIAPQGAQKPREASEMNPSINSPHKSLKSAQEARQAVRAWRILYNKNSKQKNRPSRRSFFIGREAVRLAPQYAYNIQEGSQSLNIKASSY